MADGCFRFRRIARGWRRCGCRAATIGAAGRATVMAVVGMAVLALSLSTAAMPAHAGLFGSQETERSGARRTFGKWDDVLKRYATEQTVVPPPCRGPGYDSCHYPDWVAFIESARALDPIAQLQAVARFFDDARYIEDNANWGVEDYWATPGQFMDRDGDCEDFAIAKYATLILLGWPESSLRVAYVTDMNLNIGHVVLAAEVEGRTLILDNQARNQLVPQERIRHYKPTYSLSGDQWWRHVSR